ncbi:rhomboid family intramembrane serine protease [Uliginosibacterium sp. H1]|uniref:rhomboid family intramembrane serine protease n=1 Tax=Uliginosibacterium sp. H1 TaxID=3114757 RepID=UPI002E173A21|nr:rhomboid family intramembrane serine protease [Uliginosibacterium sp. H1]
MDEQRFLDLLFGRVPRARWSHGLVVLTALVFSVQAATAGALWHIPAEWLVRLGGNQARLVLDGQFWRLPASIFLHGGLIHLGLNMLALWQVGAFVERLHGRAGLLLIYLMSGLLGALTSLWWQPGPVSVGASGAVFGLTGALAGWLLVRRGEMPLAMLREVRSGVVAFIGYSLFAGFMVPGVDNAAHVGGLLAGVVLGAGMAVSVAQPLRTVWLRPLSWAAVLLVALAGLGLWLAANHPTQPAEASQDQQLLRNLALQDMSLTQRTQQVLGALQTRQISATEAATRLENEVLPGWQQVEGMLSGLDGDAERKQMLMQYSDLRAQSVSALVRALAHGERQSLDQAENLRLRAENLLLQWQLREARQDRSGR